MRQVDWSVLPADLAALYAGAPAEPAQLELDLAAAEDATEAFRRWLETFPPTPWSKR